MTVSQPEATIAFDGRLLVDGGWTSRIPVDAARQIGADRVLGVEVSDNSDATFLPTQPKTGLQIALRAAEITRNHLARLTARRADLLLIPPTGHIALQNHGNDVAFRNLKIRVLK